MTVIPEKEIVGSQTELELAPGAEPVARTNWQLFRRRFFRHKLALAALLSAKNGGFLRLSRTA